LERATLLIADDEPLTRLDLKTLLAQMGHTIVGEAADGEQALTLARSLRPDVVILDIVMPRLSGVDVARALLSERVAPVVVLTGHAEPEIIDKAAEAGVLAFLAKPFRREDLEPAIEIARARFQELVALEDEVRSLNERMEARKLVGRAKAILMERYLLAAGEILDEARPERLFFARPGKATPRRAAGRKIIAHFALRAFRRPVETAELGRLMRLFDQATGRGKSFEDSVKLALKAVLVSPHFLFRVEGDQDSARPYPISDWELASRLSYFLWSSLPDEELFRLAGQKRLRDPRVLEMQVRRMIRSPKSRALADSFAGQWLGVRDLYAGAKPDPRRNPHYTPSLRDAMYNEPIAFFHNVLREDASLLRLLDADYTYVNAELARHYGIEGVYGPDMRRVRLQDGRRGGVLTMAGVLTLTSYPRRTSPVLRGKWVLEEILGAPPPPPPPNAGSLPADDAPKEGPTFRQRLEKHREKPACASCHSRMDPIGFGLENFDSTGRWRTNIAGTPVDASGVLASGEEFSGPMGLKKHLLARKEDFARNLTEKMLAYALGRGLEYYDQPTVRKITAAVTKDGYRSSTLIREIVTSYPFQYRKNL
jgi:AmiR/NasT family two-component response regulator